MTSPGAQPEMTHALSFDIEDWFHIVEIKGLEDPAKWPQLSKESSLVERYTDLILQICADHNTRATFYMLGWIAEQHPGLVRRIAEAGHEIGTHSFWHRKVFELDRAEFESDIRRSLDAIHAAAGDALSEPITGFRAPSFSITEGAEWAFDVLLDCGLTYDASLFPAKRGHGGYACTPGAHIVTAPSGRELPELPMSIAPVGLGPIKKPMCYSGGGYLRLLTSGMIEQGIKAERSAGRPTVVYLHPRDFAPDTPRVPMPPHRKFKCYVGCATTERKLRSMLTNHRWDTCRSVLESQLGRSLAPASETEPAA